MAYEDGLIRFDCNESITLMDEVSNINVLATVQTYALFAVDAPRVSL